MDAENVLTLTDDEVSLDIDMQNWSALPFDLRKFSDDSCMQKYGMTNTELYNKLKNDIYQSKPLGESAIDDMNELLYKLNRSYELQYSIDVIILDEWLDDNTPPSKNYLERLETKFHQYLSLNEDIRQMSDNYSVDIWGRTVYDMYEYLKAKYNTHIASKEISFRHEDSLYDYVKDITENCKYYDSLTKKLKKLDIVSSKKSIYESAVLGRLCGSIDDPKNSLTDYDEDIPLITPYFTPDEIRDITGTEVNPYDYDLRDPKKLAESIRKAFDENNTDELLRLGWNPNVEFTAESIKYAREKQLRWFKENKCINIIDLTKFNALSEANEVISPIVQLEPVYIVLLSHSGLKSKTIRLATHAEYSHSGISLDSSMENIYSFNAPNDEGKGGFSRESLKFYRKSKDVVITVLAFFVTPEVKERIKNVIGYYEVNKSNTKYDFKDLFRIVLKKTKDIGLSLSMVCSQFVDTVLKMVNIDLTGKPSNLVVPGDFTKQNNPNAKLYVLYTGDLSHYKKKEVDAKVNKLIASDLNPDKLLVKPVGEMVEGVFINKYIDSFFVTTENTQVNEVLKEIRELLTPTSVIIEAKQLPVRFNKDGELYIDTPRDLEREYQEAHKLLLSYNEDNIQGIKRQVARLFYVNSILEKKIKKLKKSDDNYKVLIDLRARVLNDFYKYMTIIQKEEPEFDMEQYMKNTEYYNKAIKVDKHTMKYSGKLIKDTIKAITQLKTGIKLGGGV